MKPERRISQFDGLYGERGTQHNSEYLYSEQLQTRSRHYNWDIRPHVHPRLYQLFWVTKGKFLLYEAGSQRLLKSPCLIFIPPMAVHGFLFNAQNTGQIFTMADSLVQNLFPPPEGLPPSLASLQCITVFGDYSFKQIQGLVDLADQELFLNHANKRMLLRACLQQLLLMIDELGHTAAAHTADHVSMNYFRRFQELIRAEGPRTGIGEYALQLAITPVHLNRICRRIAGKSAGQLIQEHLLNEAKKYLTYTSYSVSEIAYLLHFEYPNYFARFFRKHTGMSPGDFRKTTMEV